MKPTIVTMFPDGFLFNYTYKAAIINLTKELGLNHIHLNMLDNPHDSMHIIPELSGPAIFIYVYHPNHSPEDYAVLKQKLPNSQVWMLGGDMCYFGYENSITWPIDLAIEYMQESVDRISTRFKCEKLMWFPSVDVFNRIRELKAAKPVVEKKYDLICLARMSCSFPRQCFINQLLEKNLTIKTNLNEWDLDKVIEHYFECKYTLGISHSVWDTNLTRSGKGFRDWIGPECGSLLIYDDFPDVVNFSDLIPIYPFSNAQGVRNIVDHYNNNHEDYIELLEKQRTLMYDAALENQLRPLLKNGYSE